MSGTMRRVGTVRLAARSDALVRRGSLLLEDALRTASLPEAGPSRVLLIRSLPVGVIRGDLPPSSLALTIERRVRELAISAVHAGDPSAGHRPAVFFRDDAEPSVMLAGRLARGEPISAWFWPLAVQDFHPGQPRDEALRQVLATALRTSAGPAAGMRLIETLYEEGGLEVLLESLRWQEGAPLLQAFGGSPPAPAPPTGTADPDGPETAPLSAPLRAMAARWVEAWGAGDARSVWLTAMALVLERRGRLADVRLFERAARIATALVSRQEAPAAHEGAHVSSTASPDVMGAERLAVGSAPSSSIPHPGAASPSAAVPSRPEPPPGIPAERPEETAGSAGTPPPATPSAGTPRPSSVTRGSDGRAAPSASEPDAKPLPHWPEVPRPTLVGGLLFLLPILERMGISALLEEHPSLLELDVPDRLLSLIAERLGAPATDPSRVILDTHVRGPRPTRCPFTLPERLRAQVAGREAAPRVFRAEGPTERAVLTDASGRLPLSVTYAVTPEPAPLQDSGTLPPALHGEDDLGLLLRGLLTALRRWCRRHARMGLHDLVRRPGRITATRTHIDVLFDIQQVDIRVRGAGLDIDPGWVPWLGRVVRFHYLYGEE